MSGRREALVLLPGFLCDRAVWERQIEALSDVAECACADYGMLDSIPAMAESVLRTAPDQFSVAGHSMGGRIAFEIFRIAPRRVRRLAVFDSGSAARPAGPTGAEEERNRRRLLARIRCPALILTGREDAWSPPTTHKLMAGAIPGAKLVIVPDSGHMAPMEQPAAVTRAMREWLT